MATLFEQIKEHVRGDIRAGKYRVGDVLPSVEELADSAGCSIGTARRALTELAQCGILRRVQCRGTVVARAPGLGRVCLLLGKDLHTNLLLQDPVYEALLAAGYEVELIPTAVARSDGLFSRLEMHGPDREELAGVVLIEAEGIDDAVQHALGRYPRTVLFSFNDSPVFPGVSQVGPDHQVAAREVVKHLLAQGHRRVAVFAGIHAQERSWVSQSARHALHMLEVGGAEGLPYYMAGAEGDEGIIKRIVADKVTALWCINDHHAMLLLNVAHRAGLRVPEDLALVGRWDTPWSRQCLPDLTTVSLNPVGVARALVRFLQGDDAGSGRLDVIEPELIARGSTVLAVSQRQGAVAPY